jgi:type IV pilus assembly protein PilP
MSDRDLKNSEIPEELMDSLRQAYRNGKVNSGDECPRSEMAIAYASGELEPEKNQKFRDHLHTCHFCLNLVLDVQVAESESNAHDGQKVKVLPAFSKAIKKSKNQNSIYLKLKRWPVLIARSWYHLSSPKMIAALATACFAFIIIYYGLNDSEIINQFKKVNKKIVIQKSKPTQPDITEPDTPTKERIEIETPSATPRKYNPKGKIEPFQPFFKEKGVVPQVKKNKRKKRVPRTPLERLDLSQLKLVGIILSPNGNKALLEDSSGKGYVISKGTYIGVNAGKVVEIEKDRVIVAEEVEDAMGNVTIQRKELKLHK